MSIYLDILIGVAVLLLALALIYVGFSGGFNPMFLLYEIGEDYLYVRVYGFQAEKIAFEEILSVEKYGFRWPGADFISSSYVSAPFGVLRITTISGKSIYISPGDRDAFKEQLLASVCQTR